MSHSDEARAKALELLRNPELSYPEIAKATGVPVGTLGGWAKREGIKRSTVKTQAATEARAARIAERRAKLAEKILRRAEAMLDAIDEPVTVHLKGGGSITYEHADPAGAKNYAVAFGVLLDKFRLERGEHTSFEKRDETRVAPSEKIAGKLDELEERRKQKAS